MTTPEIIDQIHELILEDHRSAAKSTAEQLGISRHSWRCGHAEALREVGPEMTERGSKTSKVSFLVGLRTYQHPLVCIVNLLSDAPIYNQCRWNVPSREREPKTAVSLIRNWMLVTRALNLTCCSQLVAHPVYGNYVRDGHVQCTNNANLMRHLECRGPTEWRSDTLRNTVSTKFLEFVPKSQLELRSSVYLRHQIGKQMQVLNLHPVSFLLPYWVQLVFEVTTTVA